MAGLAPLVTDPAPYGSQQGEGGPEDANRREEADNAALPPGETASAAVGAVQASTVTPRRDSPHNRLQQATKAFLDAWDARAANDDDIADKLTGHVAALRSALAASASVAAAIDPSRPEKHTKQAQVLAMLRRNEGTSGPQIAETMGWASNTVRGFLAGLAKKGHPGRGPRACPTPDNRGAKGSYTVYRVADTSKQ